MSDALEAMENGLRQDSVRPDAELGLRVAIRELLDAFERATENEVATLPVITQELAARGIELPPWLMMI